MKASRALDPVYARIKPVRGVRRGRVSSATSIAESMRNMHRFAQNIELFPGILEQIWHFNNNANSDWPDVYETEDDYSGYESDIENNDELFPEKLFNFNTPKKYLLATPESIKKLKQSQAITATPRRLFADEDSDETQTYTTNHSERSVSDNSEVTTQRNFDLGATSLISSPRMQTSLVGPEEASAAGSHQDVMESIFDLGDDKSQMGFLKKLKMLKMASKNIKDED